MGCRAKEAENSILFNVISSILTANQSTTHSESSVGKHERHALFATAALANHSCLSNAHEDVGTFFCKIRSCRCISRGEEVKVSYVPPCETVATRREKLLHGYGIDCQCEKCAQQSGINAYEPHVMLCCPSPCQKKWTYAEDAVDKHCFDCDFKFTKRTVINAKIQLTKMQSLRSQLPPSPSNSALRPLMDLLKDIDHGCYPKVIPDCNTEMNMLLHNIGTLSLLNYKNNNGGEEANREWIENTMRGVRGCAGTSLDADWFIAGHPRLLKNFYGVFKYADWDGVDLDLKTECMERMKTFCLSFYGSETLPPSVERKLKSRVLFGDESMNE